MTNPREKILESAVAVFMRYGVGCTRMGDIAKEAGVVRQTLYSFFKTKDDLLAGAILHVSARSVAEIKSQWSDCAALGDLLDVYFQQAILSSYRIISASEEARDMIGGYNEIGKAASVTAQAQKIALWEVELTARRLIPTKAATTPAELAEFIVLSCLGLRDMAESEQQLKTLLQTQKTALLALVTSGT